MLYQSYSKNIPEAENASLKLSIAETTLLTAIQSKSRFEQLMEILPDDWEEIYTINVYNDPNKVSQHFMNSRRFKGHSLIEEHIVTAIIVNDKKEKEPSTGKSHLKYNAVPAVYDEHLKRDYDYPIEDDKWKNNHDLTEYHHPTFHVDHRLIWIVKEKNIGLHSNISIEDVPYVHSINIYVPTPDILIEVENMKLNGVL